jgi:hypothetical protein
MPSIGLSFTVLVPTTIYYYYYYYYYYKDGENESCIQWAYLNYFSLVFSASVLQWFAGRGGLLYFNDMQGSV